MTSSENCCSSDIETTQPIGCLDLLRTERHTHTQNGCVKRANYVNALQLSWASASYQTIAGDRTERGGTGVLHFEILNVVDFAKMCLLAFVSGSNVAVAAHKQASHSKYPASLNDELRGNRKHTQTPPERPATHTVYILCKKMNGWSDHRLAHILLKVL